MKITSRPTHATVTRQFTIDADHPVADMAYARPPKKVRIERGVIHYTLKDGRWIVDTPYAIDIAGTVLKKDGTPSANSHKRSPKDDFQASLAAGELVLSEDFTWLKPIIDLLRPSGELAMFHLNDTEVSG